MHNTTTKIIFKQIKEKVLEDNKEYRHVNRELVLQHQNDIVNWIEKNKRDLTGNIKNRTSQASSCKIPRET